MFDHTKAKEGPNPGIVLARASPGDWKDPLDWISAVISSGTSIRSFGRDLRQPMVIALSGRPATTADQC